MTKLLKTLIVVLFALFATINFSSAQQWSAITANNIWSLNTGNVGIGTTAAPKEKLEINGNIRGNQTAGAVNIKTDFGSIWLGPMNALWAHIGTDMPKFILNKPIYAQTGEFSSYVGIDLSLQTYGTTRMTVLNSNGYVGIGTTTPIATLDVHNTLTTDGTDIIANFQRASTNNSGSAILRLGFGSGTADFESNGGMSQDMASGFRYGSFNDINIVNNTTGGVWGGINFATNGVTRMAMNANGKIGIGTITPNAKIESVSGVNANPATGQTTQSGAALRLRGGDNAVLDFGMNSINTWIQATDQSDLHQTYKISLNPNGGNVGIGTTSPLTRLDVQTASNQHVQITQDLNGNLPGCVGIVSINDGNTAYTPLGFNASKYYFVNGNVSIGTTLPDPTNARLTVNGTIHAKEVDVDVNIPADFVFKSGYKLMPLKDVEKYVKINSHLPEIPSAEEITKNGFKIGEMQNKLLQKVEELTLYMIEQQKTINQQSAQINQQSAKIEELEKKLK